MSSHRIRGALAVAATVVLLATVTAGCGRRGLAAGAGPDAAGDGGAGPASAATQPTVGATAPGVTGPTPSADPAGPPAATEPTSTTDEPAPSPHPTPAPLVAPDLTAIERLLADLDAALGADATADTEEGSAP
jgi:hypothetical protein